MKQSTFDHSENVALEKNNRKNKFSEVGKILKQKAEFIRRTIIVNICSLFVGLLPMAIVSTWRTFSRDVNFMYDFLVNPDIIFVSIALWVTYLGSKFVSGAKRQSIFSILNFMAVF